MNVETTKEPAAAGATHTAALRLLSPVQRRVLALIGAGMMTKEIASELGIGENGVEWHRKQIYRKLNLKSVADAVRVAIESNVIAAPHPDPLPV